MKNKIDINLNSLWCVFIFMFLFIQGILSPRPFLVAGFHIFLRGSNYEQEESFIAQSIRGRMNYINANGLVANIMNQKILNEVVRDKNGQLYRIGQEIIDEFDKNYVDKAIYEVDEIFKCCKENDIQFLYVERPVKYNLAEKELPYGYTTIPVFEQGQYRLNYCSKNNEPYFDLTKELDKNLEFFKTDHHWTVDSSMYAAEAIEKKLGHSTNVYDRKFNNLIYKNSLLGSCGIRIGKYYNGMDDFIIPVPDFQTDLSYKHFIDGELILEKEGDFVYALLDSEKLQNKKYFNKYDACLNGSYVETVIINNLSENNSKVLIISDSYGRAMTMYSCLNYYETRYLDPQIGRYNYNYLEYIKKYEPDTVIVMAPEQINVGDW